MSLVHFLSIIYGWACSLPVRVIRFPEEIPLENSKFSFAIGDSFQARNGCLCPLSFQLQHPSCRPWACCLSLWEFICAAILLIEKAFISLCPPSYLTLTLFLPPLLWDFLILEGMEFKDTSLLRRSECLKVSHYLHNVQLWVSVFVPICCRRQFL